MKVIIIFLFTFIVSIESFSQISKLKTIALSTSERVSAVCIESLKKSGFVLSGIKFSKPPEDFNNMALHDNIQALIVKLEGEDDETVDLLRDAIDAAK